MTCSGLDVVLDQAGNLIEVGTPMQAVFVQNKEIKKQERRSIAGLNQCQSGVPIILSSVFQ